MRLSLKNLSVLLIPRTKCMKDRTNAIMSISSIMLRNMISQMPNLTRMTTVNW
jgi:hypothetical protein